MREKDSLGSVPADIGLSIMSTMLKVSHALIMVIPEARVNGENVELSGNFSVRAKGFGIDQEGRAVLVDLLRRAADRVEALEE